MQNFKVAVCDDVPNELQQMLAALKAYEQSHPAFFFDTASYHTAFDILQAVENGEIYDIALLDICMPGILGTDVAAKILAKAPDTDIIFLTTSDEYAVEAFAINATHYLLKPFTGEQFDAALDRAVAKRSEETTLSLSCVDGMYRVRINEIISVESQGHYLFLHLCGGETLKQRDKLTQIYEKLCKFPEFIRIGSSYIVNFAFVRKVSADIVELPNGKIPIPRRSSSEVQRMYIEFCRKEARK